MTEFDLIWTDEEKQEAEKEAYNQALKDLSKKINETFWEFQGAEGSRNRLLLDKIIEDLKEGKEE